MLCNGVLFKGRVIGGTYFRRSPTGSPGLEMSVIQVMISFFLSFFMFDVSINVVSTVS